MNDLNRRVASRSHLIIEILVADIIGMTRNSQIERPRPVPLPLGRRKDARVVWRPAGVLEENDVADMRVFPPGMRCSRGTALLEVAPEGGHNGPSL